MNYYPHHIGDFRSGTVSMSRLERWIYRDLLDVYYDTEKPLPAGLDAVCYSVGANSDEERRIVENLLKFKFKLTDVGYMHERCESEIAAYRSKAETAQANGKKGGRPKKPPVTDPPSGLKPDQNPQKPSWFPSGSDPDATGNPAQTGSQTNQEPITKNQYVNQAAAVNSRGELPVDNSESPPPDDEEAEHPPTGQAPPVGPAQHEQLPDGDGSAEAGLDADTLPDEIEFAQVLSLWEAKRGKRVAFGDKKSMQVFRGWCELGLTLEQLREAYRRAVARRDDDRDSTPVNAAFLDRFVDEVRAPPREVTLPLASMSGIQLLDEAKRLGIDLPPGMERPEAIAKIAQRRAEQRGGHAP